MLYRKNLPMWERALRVALAVALLIYALFATCPDSMWLRSEGQPRMPRG